MLVFQNTCRGKDVGIFAFSAQGGSSSVVICGVKPSLHLPGVKQWLNAGNSVEFQRKPKVMHLKLLKDVVRIH